MIFYVQSVLLSSVVLLLPFVIGFMKPSIRRSAKAANRMMRSSVHVGV